MKNGKKNFIERLMKSKKEIDPEVTGEEEIEDISKSFDSALMGATKLIKSDDNDEDSDEDSDEDDSKKKSGSKFWKNRYKALKSKMNKSSIKKSSDYEIDDLFKSNDVDEVVDEDEIFVDAEPIIKSIFSKLAQRLDAIEGKIDSVEEIQKSLGELQIASANALRKSVAPAGSLNRVLPRKGAVSEYDRSFIKSENSDEKRTLSKAEATKRLGELIKSNAITTTQVSVIESRINNGADLPDIMFTEFDKGSK